MRIEEFVQNNSFDVNCCVEIYDVSSGKNWEESLCVFGPEFSVRIDDPDILQADVRYVTINPKTLAIILEALPVR